MPFDPTEDSAVGAPIGGRRRRRRTGRKNRATGRRRSATARRGSRRSRRSRRN
jgi:hypothetical protein